MSMSMKETWNMNRPPFNIFIFFLYSYSIIDRKSDLISWWLWMEMLFPSVMSQRGSHMFDINSEIKLLTKWTLFLVACTRLYKSLCRSVGPSVGRSVRNHFVRNHFALLRFFRHLEVKRDQIWVTAPAQLLYCPCPPARDWCCRVYGLVFLISRLDNF